MSRVYVKLGTYYWSVSETNWFALVDRMIRGQVSWDLRREPGFKLLAGRPNVPDYMMKDIYDWEHRDWCDQVITPLFHMIVEREKYNTRSPNELRKAMDVAERRFDEMYPGVRR